MSKIRFVGLDVHSRSIAIAVADADGQPPENLAVIANDTQQLLHRLRKLGSLTTLRVVYEAGPTGFGLCRDLRSAGIECMVAAPSLVPVQVGDRVKTDRRDAAKLARFLRSGDLTGIYVPAVETEAMRDLVRAREDARKSLQVCRHQLGKFLLRHGRLYEGKSSWTQRHLEWVRTQKFSHRADDLVLVDYLKSVEDAVTRVETLTQNIAELLETWSLKPIVKALQAFRGIQMVTAVTIIAELGDLKRFQTAPELMAYLGLVPSEHSSGESRRRGRITRTGNTHVRRVLVESSWSYRYRPSMSYEIKKRNEGVAHGVQKIAWKAQQRLHNRYLKMMIRGKTRQKIIVAIARELAGFIWAVGREETLLAS